MVRKDPRVRSVSLRAAPAAFGIAAALAACGSGSSSDEAQRPPDQVLSDSAAAVRAVHSYHLVGTIRTATGTGDVDLRVAAADDFMGTITSSGVRVDVVVAKGVTYLHGRDFFLRTAGQSAADAIGDRWARLPGNPLGDFGAVTDSRRLADRMLGCHGTIRLSGTTTVDGRRALELVDAGDLPGTTPTTLDVALDGPPYPVRVIQQGNAHAGTAPAACGSLPATPAASPGSSSGAQSSTTISLSEFGAGITVSAPAQAVDLSHGTS
jgi:hypothetical protein